MSVLRSRFFWKIYATFASLFLAATLVVSWIAFAEVRSTLSAIVIDDLRARAEFLVPAAREALRGAAATSFAVDLRTLAYATGTRITLIRAGGGVAMDTDGHSEDMENHWQRPEVQQALAEPYGHAQRPSSTLGRPMMYLARAIRDGNGRAIGVIRVSLGVDKIQQQLQRLGLTMGAIAAVGAMLALALGWRLTRKIALPIGEMVEVAEAMRSGHYERRVTTRTSDELGRLGDTLNRLGAELAARMSELHRLETVRRDFVANVSHEIKTPLTSIKGYIETLQTGAIDDPDRRERFLEKIDRNASRLTALVQDLLSLAKIEATEGTFMPTPCEWGPVIASVIARNEDSIVQKNLRIKTAMPESPVIVIGDKEAMTQILDNLLTNAIKYTPEGGWISVQLAARGGFGVVEVEDTGIGIPSEHLDRIFERFYRVDKARSRDLGGTGLGLSIVKHLVSALGGDVGVESRVGAGSRFTVRLKIGV